VPQNLDLASARWFVEQIMIANTYVSSIADSVEKLESLDERRMLRRGLAELMDHLNMEVLRPVVRQYPELDPDQ